MTTLIMDAPARAGEATSLFESSSGGPTLEAKVSGVWEGLSAHEIAACPVCGGDMRPQYSAGAGSVGGSCRDCGSSLS